MRVRVFHALALTALLAASLSACNSGGSGDTSAATSDTSSATSDTSTTAQGPLALRDFKNKVAAAIITGTDLQADPGFGSAVDVSEQNGLDTIQVVLDDVYKDYTADPARQQEIVGGVVQDVVRQMDEGNSKRSFADVKDKLMPVLKRRVDAQRVKGAAVTPFGGLDVIYAVQGDHFFTVATEEDLQRWGKSTEAIHSLALSNLEKQTNREQKLLCEPSGSQKLCGWASGDGYDATRMLVPGLRRQIVKELGGPAVYAVPLESVFVALTRNYAPVIKGKVLQEFTTGENPLSPELFEERNGRLVALSQ